MLLRFTARSAPVRGISGGSCGVAVGFDLGTCAATHPMQSNREAKKVISTFFISVRLRLDAWAKRKRRSSDLGLALFKEHSCSSEYVIIRLLLGSIFSHSSGFEDSLA